VEDRIALSSSDRLWLGALCLKAGGGFALRDALRSRLEAEQRVSPLHYFFREIAQRGQVGRKIGTQRRFVAAVVLALSAIMYADDEVHENEHRLVARLSRDYCDRFAPDVQPPEPGSVGWSEVESRIRALQWTEAETRWLLEACELVMAADSIQRERERDILQRLMACIRRT
jgi:hypothetical protein